VAGLLGTTTVISLFTKRKPDSELVGLVKGLTPATSSEGVPLYQRPAVWAIAAFAVLVALNVYFW